MGISSEFLPYINQHLINNDKRKIRTTAKLLIDVKLSEIKFIHLHYGKCVLNITNKVFSIDINFLYFKIVELLQFIEEKNSVCYILCNCSDEKLNSICKICEDNCDKDLCKLCHNKIFEFIKDKKILYCKRKMEYTLNMATDGACIGNGRATAKASYSVYFPESILGPSFNISGLVSSDSLFNENNISDLYAIIHRCDSLPMACESIKDIKINPSNIRGELYGIYYAIKFIYDNIETIINKKIVKIKIITDSEYSIKVYSIWLENWFKKNAFQKKKNLDIILNTYDLILKIKDQIEIEFIHINSHLTKDQKSKLNETDALYSFWNEIADKLATNILNNKDSDQ